MMNTHSAAARWSRGSIAPAAAKAVTHSRCKQNHITTASRRTSLGASGNYRTYTAAFSSINSRTLRAGAFGSIQDHPHADELEVYTTEGHKYQVPIHPGETTNGELRRAVAQHMGTSVNNVRLAYYGDELPPADDGEVFHKRPGVDVLHAMRRPVASEPGQQPKQETLKVYTMEGRMHQMTVTPGVTTAGDIRKAVAAATGAAVSEVRLQYAGQELDPSQDHKVMQFKPAVLVIHTMKRMQGGCGSVSNSSSSSRSSKYQDVHSQASTRCRRKPTTHGRQYAWQTFPVAPKSFSNSFSTPMTSHTTAKAAAQMFNEAGALGASVTLTPAVTAPGAGHGPAPAQLARQFRDLLKHPIPGVSAAPDDEDPMMWHVRLAGPADTPYAGGWFHVELHFINPFPGLRPAVRFRTKIWHPNVTASDGRVCINLGDQVCSVACVLSALQQLLKHPNPKSAWNPHCASEMLKQPDVYLERARSMTSQYAMK